MLKEIILGTGKLGDLTSYFSMDYLMFFLPAVILIYSVLGAVPKWGAALRRYALLALSYLFFMLISGGLVLYLVLTTLVMFFFGKWIEKLHEEEWELLHRQQDAQPVKEYKKAVKSRYLHRRRGVFGLAAAFHIGFLLVLKYSGFFVENVNALLTVLGLPVSFAVPKFLMPIGISFFTMQAVSYLFDVYRKTIPAEQHIGKLALFISFFPQIVEGPICRYGQTADQLWQVENIGHHNLVFGLQRILFGMMKKMVIADRLNPLITEVFTNYENYDGKIAALAAVCYTIQLYMEFSGTMDAVIGTAEIFGVKLPENFARPFFSKTISDFWGRWHISLGAWFKDYLFYPVTLSKPVKNLTKAIKKKVGNYTALLAASAIALFCVWFCNGLWHGAAWNYIFFGMYHFGLILLGNVTEPLNKRIRKILHIRTECKVFQLFQILRTSVLVVLGELFFRCHGLKAGFLMLKMIATNFSAVPLTFETLEALGLDRYDIIVLAAACLLVLMTSVLKERGVKLRETFAAYPAAVRWSVMYAGIFFIIIFGAYGLGYLPVDPIYANF